MEVDYRFQFAGISGLKTYMKGFTRSFKAIAGGNATIVKIEYNITFNHAGQPPYNYNFSENVTNGSNSYEITDATFSTGAIEMAYISGNQLGNPPISNLQAKIKATSSTGAVLEQTITPTYTFVAGL